MFLIDRESERKKDIYRKRYHVCVCVRVCACERERERKEQR